MSKLIATGLERHYWCMDCGAYIANAGVTAHAIANPTHRLEVLENLTATDPALDLFTLPGNLNIADGGIIYYASSRFIHAYKDVARTGQNFFAGLNAGNRTMGATGANVYNGSGNVGVGDNALLGLTEGYYNCAFGLDALKAATTPYGDCAFGYKALAKTTVGIDNSGFGLLALAENVDGDGNSAFGSDALGANISGDNNCAFGYTALVFNTTASGNSAFGAACLAANLIGYDNAGFGHGALNANLANNNSAFGKYALKGNTSGSSNCAFGTVAMENNLIGLGNCVFGYAAGHDILADGNVVFGYAALRYATGSYNTAVGNRALFNVIIGQYNTVLGANAGESVLGSGNVLLGYRAGFYETGSNKLYIANSDTAYPLIAGDFSTRNLGIGTLTAPAQRLDIGGGHLRFSFVAAPGAASIALGAAGGLNTPGVHSVKVTFVTSSGETELGTVSANVTVTAANEVIELTNIPVSPDPSCTGRNIWMTQAGGSVWYRVSASPTINNNTATVYSVSVADASLVTAGTYLVNSTAGILYANTTAFFEVNNNGDSVWRAQGGYPYHPFSGQLQICLGANGLGVNSSAGLTTLGMANSGDLIMYLGKLGVRNTSPAALVTIGTAGTLGGSLSLAGSASGVVTIQTVAAAGTWTWTLPTTDGDAGEVLVTDGSGITSWGIGTTLVDLTGASKTTTGNAVAAGGTATGSIDLGISAGVCVALRVKANGVTVDSDIQFFTAAGAPAADQVYEALAKDCNTAPYHVDGTPWAIPSFGAALAGQLLYYVITNNGANDSTYDIEMVLLGKV